MKTIEEAEREYSLSSYPTNKDMQFACEMHFEAGVDPKEALPEDDRNVLLKTNDDYDVYSVGYFNGNWWGGNLPVNAEVIGWREINE
ncbi:MAG: hypothetical protein ACLSVO_02895 [Alistipes sp.]|uniref:hypothetical protein n=1 Tax=Alistipes sp. TaxID=1872444 RepID=UPI0039911334